jgi:hypothetical protein
MSEMIYWRKWYGDDRSEAFVRDPDCGMSMRITGYDDQVSLFIDLFAHATNREGQLLQPGRIPDVIPGQMSIDDGQAA